MFYVAFSPGYLVCQESVPLMTHSYDVYRWSYVAVGGVVPDRACVFTTSLPTFVLPYMGSCFSNFTRVCELALFVPRASWFGMPTRIVLLRKHPTAANTPHQPGAKSDVCTAAHRALSFVASTETEWQTTIDRSIRCGRLADVSSLLSFVPIGS